MIRLPDEDSDGTMSSFNIATQEPGQNIPKISQRNNTTGTVQSVNADSDNSIMGYSAFQLGVEGVMTNSFCDLEAGVDLGFASLDSDIANVDEAFWGANLRLGGVLKYAFTPQDDLMITPYIRSLGFLIRVCYQ